MKRHVDPPQRAVRARLACALAVALSCAPFAAASPLRGDGVANAGASSAEASDAQSRVQKLLHEAVAQSVDADQLARRLITLGRAAVPELFDELSRRWTAAHDPVLARDGASLTAHGVLRALAQLPREAVELELARRLTPAATRDTRAAAFLLLGEARVRGRASAPVARRDAAARRDRRRRSARGRIRRRARRARRP